MKIDFKGKHLPHIVSIIIGVLTIVCLYLGWQFFYLNTQNSNLQTLLEDYTSSTYDELGIKNATIAKLGEELQMTTTELNETQDDLRSEQNRNDAIENQISDIVGTVSDLDKLSKTDKELLQKYSKISFLNEHYIPESLKQIDDEWKYTESKNLELHSKVMPFFEDMVEEAKYDDVNLWVVSAYRSFGTQASLKGAYLQTYGSGANAFSADQGFSEHQLGTAIDFTTNDLGGGLDGFGKTEAYQWLLDNAYKYGFVLSYPEGNGYYVYEPWHWRFVGEDLARDLHKDEAHFYDWDQREIDDYLLHIFD